MFRSSITIIKGGSGLLQKSQSLSPLLVATAQKHHAVASTEAKPDRISKNLSFRSAYDSPFEQNDRPMVLLYSWLAAKAKHMHKYSDFYMKKGYDVLHVKINPTQLLMPSQARKVVGQVVDFMQQPQRADQPILVHGFSVGVYLYGETLVNIASNEATLARMRERIAGQIYDSPVSFTGISYGISRAVTEVKLLQHLLHAAISGYLAAMPATTWKQYVTSQRTLEENPLKAPAMFLYSRGDKIGPPGPTEEAINSMKQHGNDKVFTKCWPDSRHVGHFHAYPVEYMGMLTYFLQEIGLLVEQEQERISMTG